MNRVVPFLLALIGSSQAFAPAPFAGRHTTSLEMSKDVESDMSRIQFLKQAAGVAISLPLLSPLSAYADDEVKLASGVSYTVTKSGDGPKPDIGELAGVRFKAVCVPTGNTIDDLFDNPEPYYTRVGSGGLIKVNL